MSNEKGQIILNWDIVDGSKPDRLWLRWEEIGGPPVTQPARKGFGLRMIERVPASELNSMTEVDYRLRGVVITVEASLPNRVAGE